VLWLMFKRPFVALLASAVLYAVCYALQLNIPTVPAGNWYFNPFTWQLLVVLGAWYALHGAELQGVLSSRMALTLAVAFMAFAAVVMISHQIHDASSTPPNWLEQLIFPIDKTNLGPSRLLGLLALLIVAGRLVPKTAPILGSRLARLAIGCGEHPLELFTLSVLMSFAAHIVLVNVHGAIPMQFVVSIAGLVIMTGIGVALSRAQCVVAR
jgi:hypothetical protein